MAEATELIELLTSHDSTKRAEAAEKLSQMGEDARPAAVALVRAAGDEAEEVIEWAVSALEEIGPPDPSDLHALANLLANQNSDVGYWAATLLGRLETGAASAVERLAATLNESKNPAVQERAAWALGKIGPAAAVANETLTQVAESDDQRLARQARKAIEAIQG